MKLKTVIFAVLAIEKMHQLALKIYKVKYKWSIWFKVCTVELNWKQSLEMYYQLMWRKSFDRST